MAMSVRPLLPGEARGAVLVLDAPLSMWGGLDPETGELIDRRHPQAGATLTGRIVVMPSGRGSSSSSSVLAEAIRLGTAPAAIVLRHPDDIILLGALVARELYGLVCPVVVADREDYEALRTDQSVVISGAELRPG
jgi:predicted aconitase with swiveling domain